MSRHQSVEEKLQWFEYNHLPENLQGPSHIIWQAAIEMINEIPLDSPQLSLGLQHLIDAKDCFVRAKKAYLDA